MSRLAGLNLVCADDGEVVQGVVLAASINGDANARSQLPALQSAFEEPYRTIAAVIVKSLQDGKYIDRQTVGLALGMSRLTRKGSNGAVEQLTADQVVNLIFASEIQAGQVQAYLNTLQMQLRAKRQVDFKERAVELAKTLGDDPEQLLSEIGRLTIDARRTGAGSPADFPPEMLELIPYAMNLEKHQAGAEFLGLDSGFPHLNWICNGLDVGLTVLAAPPGLGKTTLIWQVACQTAKINRVPVLFFSLEQSKDELRAKALARLSKLQCRHIQRGRLRSDDPETWTKVLGALQEYFSISCHLTIVEGDDTTTVDTILDVARSKMVKAGAGRCLIVVDYLQILPPRPQDTGRVTSTRDRVDLHVSALRRIARELHSPVIAISSENRAGYRSKQMDVFKESGGIEYSADIAMVLSRSKQVDSGKDADCRLLDLNVIKNRNGETGVVKLRFYPKRMEFVETGREELVEDVEG